MNANECFSTAAGLKALVYYIEILSALLMLSALKERGVRVFAKFKNAIFV
jgi:hypothetical protein